MRTLRFSERNQKQMMNIILNNIELHYKKTGQMTMKSSIRQLSQIIVRLKLPLP